ncbi:MAG: HAD family phosphatase [Bacteroidales bacterium]|nr:HAD family phosphatase [Bacteroidales bacterium]
MTKAIVFDLGGVLIDLDPDRCIQAFREILGFERITELLDPCHQKGIYGDMEAGILSADEFRRQILAESRPGCTPEDVDRSMAALLVGMAPYKVQLLQELSARYPLYALSNNNDISMARFHQIFEEMGLDWKHIFREELISCNLKMLKPGPEIFREAVRRIGYAPEEILFVDDSMRNIDGAQAVGIQAAYYEQGADLRLIFKDLL